MFDHKMKTGKLILYVVKGFYALLVLLGTLFVLDGLLIPKSHPVSNWPEILLGIAAIALGSLPYILEIILRKSRQMRGDASFQEPNK